MTNLLEKIAKEKEESERKKKLKDKAGVASASVGAGLVYNGLKDGKVSGRLSRYHTTPKENIENIFKKGVKGKNVDTSFTQVAGGVTPKGETYFGTKLRTAQNVAIRRKEVKDGNMYGKPFYTKDDVVKATKENPIVKAKIPYDFIKKNKVKNPELDVLKTKHQSGFITDYQYEAAKKVLDKGTDAYKGGVPKAYIKNSIGGAKNPNYVKNSPKQILRYAKKNPGRFAAGVGMTALGTAGLACGGSRLYNYIKKKKKKKKRRINYE